MPKRHSELQEQMERQNGSEEELWKTRYREGGLGGFNPGGSKNP